VYIYIYICYYIYIYVIILCQYIHTKLGWESFVIHKYSSKIITYLFGVYIKLFTYLI